MGYYIGEVDDICLDIHEIALKESKKDAEIEKKLKEIFKSLKQETTLQLVLKKYPNSEKMLQVKAKNFEIKLQTKGKQTLIEEPRKPESQEKTISENERKKKVCKENISREIITNRKTRNTIKRIS